MGIVHQAGAHRMKDRKGECWFMPAAVSDDASQLQDQFLIIVESVCKGKYYVHTFVSTFASGKFEFRTMREWTMIPLEVSAYKRVG